MKADFDHNGKAGVVPLPATMIHDLSDILNKKENGIRLNLYSAFPFPNRERRILDEPSRQVLEALRKDPDLTFVRVFAENDVMKVKVAIADKMGESCVACHNSHALSPKKDWKVGDLRGVLDVEVPIAKQMKASQDMIWSIGWMSLAGVFLLIAMIVAVLWWGTIKPFQDTIQQILVTANGTESISREVTSASDTVATNSSDQAAAVHGATEAFQRLMQEVEQKAETASKASELSQFNNEIANRGACEIEGLIASINDVSESSKRIQDISVLIDDISFQTNLLALNASVEAARAGEQGRGFAVVAEAVRTLARKSATEAKNIADIIKDNATKSSRSLEMAQSSGAILKDIVEKALRVAELVEEIVKTSRSEIEMLRNLNSSMEQIHQAAQSNAASSEQTTASMASLENEIKSLRAMTSNLEELVAQKKRSDEAVTRQAG